LELFNLFNNIQIFPSWLERYVILYI
jgi:hypothetical protein